jgi:DNA-binding NtrC family response regulator
MWFGTTDGVSRYEDGTFFNLSKEDGLIDDSILAIHSDPDGTMWFGTLGGVSQYDGERFVNFTEADGLAGNSVSAIHRDEDGAMWFSTWGNGVSRYSNLDIINLTTKDGLASDHTRTIYYDADDKIWIGGDSISRLDGNTVNIEFAVKGELTRRICGIHHTPDGYLWLASERGRILRYNGREFFDFAAEMGINKEFRAIHGNSDGTLWFGTSGSGVYRYDGEKLENFTTEHGLGHNQVWAIYCEDNNLTWFGTWGGGISRYDGKAFINFTAEDGLMSDSIFSIYRAPDNTIWFGTLHRGASCYNGRIFTNITTKDGLASNTVRVVRYDQKGMIWFGTQGGGISCYDGTAWTSLDQRDGLVGNNVYSIQELSDGRLLIATEGGITLYSRINTPPKVYIKAIITDQGHHSLHNVPAFNSGTRITIEYGSIDFKTLPAKRQYRYRIKEIDHNWRKPTKSTSFDYKFDKSGEYTFEVQAIDRDLNYSATAVVKLTVQPNPELLSLKTQLGHLRREVVEKYHFDNIIGQSIGIRQVRAMMEKAIESGLTVLISGETGTGKELVAKAIHYNSSRKDKPLLDLNCGAVPRELIASTLFGHRRGAFTGANEDKIGLFEAAKGGTVLLDEIGDMPEEAQVHLLRVLQERKIHRIGENQLRDVDVRVIAITNQDLEAEVKSGRFREDLYYRLSVFPIHVPPLRERTEDIPLLAEHFLRKAYRDQDKTSQSFADGVMDMLISYSWPGNIRELEHEIYRATALAEEGSQIQVYHFSSRITQGESLIQNIISERLELSAAIENLQRRMIENAIRECGGNHTQAAKLLGIHQPNLSRLMKRLGLT